MSTFTDTVANGKIKKIEPLGIGRFDANLVTFSDSTKAILKYKGFSNTKFRGIDRDDFPKREAAVYWLDSKLLKFNVVPETLLIKLNGKEASIQQYMEGYEARDLQPGIFDKKLPDWKYTVAKLFSKINADDLLKITLIDLIVNNTDRHARNVIFDTHGKRVWAIDNGLSLGSFFNRYRSVFHKYMFFKRLFVPNWAIRLLEGIDLEQLEDTLDPLLTDAEILQVHLRIQFILERRDKLDFFTMAQGRFEKDGFPSYQKWFERKMRPNPEIPHLLDMNQIPGWTGPAQQASRRTDAGK